MRDVLEGFLSEIRSGRRAVLATIVRATGSTPRSVGARMLVRSDGTTLGTIGGGAFEAMVAEDAAVLLSGRDPAPLVKRYAFREEGEDALGMACGGTAEVLLESGGTGPVLLVFGAGHVGMALARLAVSVGFSTEIVDDRADAVAAAKEAGIGEVRLCDAEYRDGVPALTSTTYVAVVTRCHRTDRLALRRVLGEPLAYLGLIGSRRKKTVIFEQLRAEDGATEEQLARVRCPIGLPLGGDTPEEIAVSIVAEMLQLRYGK